MELLTLAVYLPVAAVGLVFVYLTIGWGGIALIFVGLIFKFLSQPKAPKD